MVTHLFSHLNTLPEDPPCTLRLTSQLRQWVYNTGSGGDRICIATYHSCPALPSYLLPGSSMAANLGRRLANEGVDLRPRGRTAPPPSR